MFPALRSTSSRLGLRLVRWNSTDSPILPPLMTKLRTDLKTAMRAKDTPRLNVVRALISETNNAAKTSSPIQTDIQLLSLIRKRIAASKDAIEEFKVENRPELQELEEKQVTVLEEYGAQVETMSADDIKQVVSQTLSSMKEAGKKVEIGLVLKSLFAAGGALADKPADKSETARIVKDAVTAFKKN
ncbi:uncharacterized protein BO66DRAFT_390561 [Aspergillus aculeatinus CBS 121060]|uniref:Altered inheritance of mitochondria protein 41 n=3 Tax=Aspergillus TaxID=5052 RepID=A0A8G1RKQ0_9EURO|nr:GatB/YqeY domain-containing protein [Aspergillus brunneoviolaceus CBS 621.78]XP_025505524.1 GatB/YqeY domain-containing protein [Aspergillus aculeatinus CBS 121060]XP_040799049.1 GatB/YqeY domain-containing protein [Aspergillus fijiensis CBS 313.89]RAH42792.1 GatB/YqeY domain-containing protein [Aspergillus brunneoviolaceus CBS 621.78]RAH71701.1 GatB/YqeY domain-containing protein [Aspergillus aculeatinus CBS 121060]RAK75039.1 GatB/YqeY domain-containing protein [Aspergillus fijiensis CBS 3